MTDQTPPRHRRADVTDTFTHPCLACGSTIHVEAGTTLPHDCDPQPTTEAAIAKAYWAGYDNSLTDDERADPRFLVANRSAFTFEQAAHAVESIIDARVAAAKAEALRQAAAEFRQAERDGYLYLGDTSQRVPWEAVAQRLDSLARPPQRE